MGWKLFLSLVFSLVVVSLLVFYWFIPFGNVEFSFKPVNSNFSINSSGFEGMQFYNNMRYSDSKISYRISESCSLQKKNDAERALNIISEKTTLIFYSVSSEEEISISCNEENQVKGGLFVAGEGGPTSIIKSGNFNVILKGEILLIRDTSCQNPNVAIHEFFHALGFEHSDNKKNIMYPISDCNQVIGDDNIALINNIYSFKSVPDLSFENVSATMKGKYLDANITIRNRGLKNSESSKLIIYAEEEL
ncbi:MAG: matrixin family metalloprotease, partial [Nanoarchaeota archaeon]|nr:matrixin family metalloprotease [Nanoarchaeota archaeon]